MTKPAIAVADGDAGKRNRKIMPELVDAGEHLLRDEDEGEQRAQYAAGRQRITQRLAMGHGLAERIEHRAKRERPAVGDRQRLRHAQCAPDQRHYAVQHQHDEDAAPLRQHQHGLAECRGDDRHGNEHHHRQRHHARHAPAGVAVANDRGRDHPRGRGADALQRARQQQGFKGRCRDRKQAGDTIDGHAAEQDRPPPEPVGQRAHHELADAEANQEDRQHHLRPVG
ncbi:hypothetical protein V1286_005233 [Bradyrhizobium algeriense]|uniref:Uncharacterized protein n=1 Tax=Bradyrhizobium algeriense TaxID=634784 RepID=A0ABU8BGN8_9BRAD